MTKSAPMRLLTTRLRIVIAFCLTAFCLILSLHWNHKKSYWLITAPFLRGFWPLLVANALLYAYICWIAFWLTRGTKRTERVFVAGWFTGLLLSPLPVLWP